MFYYSKNRTVSFFCTAFLASLLWVPVVLYVSAESKSLAEEEATEEKEKTLIFPSAPRELRTALNDARKFVEMERYSEAVRQLDKILASEEDYIFQKDGENEEETQLFGNMKFEAEAIIASLPPRGMDMYEVEFGAKARLLVQDALEQGRLELLAEVVRRYFFTEAGSDATLLQGMYLMDIQQPATAREMFAKLRRFPRQGRRFEPILSLYYATSCLAIGKSEEGISVLEEAEKMPTWNDVKIGGVAIAEILEQERAESNGTSNTLAEWLQKQLPTWGDILETMRSNGWRLVLQNQARSVDVAQEVSMPVLAPCWRISMLDDPEGAVLAALIDSHIEKETPNDYLHSSHAPLVVGETVLMRTAWNLLAVDLRTGKRLWSTPGPGYAEIRDLLTKIPESELASALGITNTGERMHQLLACLLRHQLWGEKIYATLASDGERVFCVEDTLRKYLPAQNSVFPQLLGLAQPQNNVADGNADNNADDNQKKLAKNPINFIENDISEEDAVPNRLACYDIRTGKLIWQIDDSNVATQGIMFLGSPLCVDKTLYVIGDRNGLTQLFALEKASGKVLWTQTLCFAATRANRFQIACTPQICEGVIICPTQNGVLVGVDAVTHALRWGNVLLDEDSYEQYDRYVDVRLGAQIQVEPQTITSTEIVVSGDRILYILPGKKLVCLNVATGATLWENALFSSQAWIATVKDGIVYVDGDALLSLFSLEDGSRVECVPIPPIPRSLEKGFCAGDWLFSVGRNGDVCRLQLDREKLKNGDIWIQSTRRHDGGTLGNLTPAGDFILSQTGLCVEAFIQKDVATQYVKALREKNAKSPEADTIEATLLWEEGRIAEALPILEKGGELTHEYLKHATMAYLREANSAKEGKLLQDAEIQKMFGWMDTDREKIDFCQLTIEEMEKAQRWADVLLWARRLWEFVADKDASQDDVLIETSVITPEALMEVEGDEQESEYINNKLYQSPSVWLGCTLTRIATAVPADSTIRQELNQWAEAEFQTLKTDLERFETLAGNKKMAKLAVGSGGRIEKTEATELAQALQKRYVAFRLRFGFWEGLKQAEPGYLRVVKYTRNFTALEAYIFQYTSTREQAAITLFKTYLTLGETVRAALYLRWIEREFPTALLLDGKTATQWRTQLAENHPIRQLLDPELMEFPQGKITVTERKVNTMEMKFLWNDYLWIHSANNPYTPFYDMTLTIEDGLDPIVLCEDTLGRTLFHAQVGGINSHGNLGNNIVFTYSDNTRFSNFIGTSIGMGGSDSAKVLQPELTWKTSKFQINTQLVGAYSIQNASKRMVLESYLEPMRKDIEEEKLPVFNSTNYFSIEMLMSPEGYYGKMPNISLETNDILWKCDGTLIRRASILVDGKKLNLTTGMNHFDLENIEFYSYFDFSDTPSEGEGEDVHDDSEVQNPPEKPEKPKMPTIFEPIWGYDATIQEVYKLLVDRELISTTEYEKAESLMEFLPLQNPVTGKVEHFFQTLSRGTCYLADNSCEACVANFTNDNGELLYAYDTISQKFIWYVLLPPTTINLSSTIDGQWLYHLTSDYEIEMIHFHTGKHFTLKFPEASQLPGSLQGENLPRGARYDWNPRKSTLVGVLPDENGCFTVVWGKSEYYDESEDFDQKEDKENKENEENKENGQVAPENTETQEPPAQPEVEVYSPGSIGMIPVHDALICRFDSDGNPLWKQSRYVKGETYMMCFLPRHIPVLGFWHMEERESFDDEMGRGDSKSHVFRFLDRRNGRIIYNAQLPMDQYFFMRGNPKEKQAEFVLTNSKIVFQFSDEPYEGAEVDQPDRRSALQEEIRQREENLVNSRRYLKGRETQIAEEKKVFNRNKNHSEEEKKFFANRIKQMETELDGHRTFIKKEEERIVELKKELEKQEKIHKKQ